MSPYKHQHGWKASFKSHKQSNSGHSCSDYKEQIKNFDNLINTLKKSSMPWMIFKDKLGQIYPQLADVLDIDCALAMGMDFSLNADSMVYLNTRNRTINEQKFCIVDIETTATRPTEGQIIELGAVMLKHGEILGEFNELIYAKEVPSLITELTGINAQMLINAKPLEQVLASFRSFLGNAIFVAHGAQFDYNFVAKSCLDKLNAPLLNRRLDTFKLASAYIKAPKHGLETLKELLGINNTHHRALNDARSAAKVLEFCLNKLDSKNKIVEDLLIYH